VGSMTIMVECGWAQEAARRTKYRGRVTSTLPD
jgi:hypothetical protein